MKTMKNIYQLARGVACRILGFFWAMYIVIGFKFDFAAIECALDQEEILARREAWEREQRDA